MPRFSSFFLLAGLLAGNVADAQSLHLRPTVGTSPVRAEVGDTVRVDVWADLDSLAVSGIDMHLSLPANALEFLDGDDVQPGAQPFERGELFGRAVVLHNGLDDNVADTETGRLHLRFAAIIAAGVDRHITGEGRVASLRFVVGVPLDRALLRLEDTPILETRLVLPDGITERGFDQRTDLELSAGPRTSVDVSSWAEMKASR